MNDLTLISKKDYLNYLKNDLKEIDKQLYWSKYPLSDDISDFLFEQKVNIKNKIEELIS